MALHLVRDGRPLPRDGVAARDRELDPADFDDVWTLRESGALPRRASWFSSPEPAATQTAQLLTESDVGVLDDLRERDDAEPLDAVRARVVAVARRVLDVHAGEEVVLVASGTAWDLLRAELGGTAPDLVVVHDPR